MTPAGIENKLPRNNKVRVMEGLRMDRILIEVRLLGGALLTRSYLLIRQSVFRARR